MVDREIREAYYILQERGRGRDKWLGDSGKWSDPDCVLEMTVTS